MPAFNRINGFIEHLAHGVHDLSSDQLKIALSDTAPSAESVDPTILTANAFLANVTQISYTGISSRDLTTLGSAQSSGIYKLSIQDLTLSFTDTIAPFRYAYVYNDTATDDPLIGWYDYGSSLSFIAGESLVIDFDDTNGAFTIA
jgi:hypothetical protein